MIGSQRSQPIQWKPSALSLVMPGARPRKQRVRRSRRRARLTVTPETRHVERPRPSRLPRISIRESLCWPSDSSAARSDFYWRDVEVRVSESQVETVISNGDRYGPRNTSFVSGRADPDHHSAGIDLALSGLEQIHA